MSSDIGVDAVDPAELVREQKWMTVCEIPLSSAELV
jgi:hypothetical protein